MASLNNDYEITVSSERLLLWKIDYYCNKILTDAESTPRSNFEDLNKSLESSRKFQGKKISR